MDQKLDKIVTLLEQHNRLLRTVLEKHGASNDSGVILPIRRPLITTSIFKMSDADPVVRGEVSPYRCLADLGFLVAPSTDEVSCLIIRGVSEKYPDCPCKSKKGMTMMQSFIFL